MARKNTHLLRHAYVKEAMGIASKDRCSTDAAERKIYQCSRTKRCTITVRLVAW
jgi:hypothetical protein